MANSRCARTGPLDRDGGGDATGRGHQPALGQHLSPLRLRSVGPPVAAAMCQGRRFVVRYADDTIVGFEHRHEAELFLADLKARLARFGLALHPDKTRLIEFGRCAIANRRTRGLGKPKSFDFLGFTHFAPPVGAAGLRAREEASPQANACQASRDQGAANGHTPRRDRNAGPLAPPGSARLDGLLCCADQRLGDLSIPASHDRTLARRADTSKPKTSTYVDENEEDR